MVWWTRRFGLPLWRTMDAMIPGLVIAAPVGERTKRVDGQAVLSSFIDYHVIHGIIETSRGELDRGFFFNGMLSTSQLISIFVFAGAPAGLALLLRQHRARAGSAWEGGRTGALGSRRGRGVSGDGAGHGSSARRSLIG